MHYAALGQPQDAGEFIAALQGKLRTSLDRFDRVLAEGTTGGVAIVKKHGEPWIRVSPRGKQEEPENLVAVKGEIERRWGSIDLLDILKYAEFDTGFIEEFTSVATREMLWRLRQPQVRRLVQQPDDRVASAPPGPRGDDLLARRAEVRLHLLPVQVVFGLRGRLDDRGRAAALH